MSLDRLGSVVISRALLEPTTAESRPPPAVWPSLAMVVAGSLMVVLWPVFTTLHGPTSFNEEGHLLGMDSLFWGAMMEGPAGLLIALGLAGSYRLLTDGAGRTVRVGFALTMIGLVLPALVNLAILAVMPPLLAPLLGIGLILMAVGNRSSALGRAQPTAPRGIGARAAPRLLVGPPPYRSTSTIGSTATASTAPWRPCSTAQAGSPSASASGPPPRSSDRTGPSHHFRFLAQRRADESEVTPVARASFEAPPIGNASSLRSIPTRARGQYICTSEPTGHGRGQLAADGPIHFFQERQLTTR